MTELTIPFIKLSDKAITPSQANSELFFFQMRMKMDVNIVRPAEIVVHTAYKKSE